MGGLPQRVAGGLGLAVPVSQVGVGLEQCHAGVVPEGREIQPRGLVLLDRLDVAVEGRLHHAGEPVLEIASGGHTSLLGTALYVADADRRL
jgi:hypothetical protein